MQQFDHIAMEDINGGGAVIKFRNVSSLEDIQITRWHRMHSIYQDFYLHQIRPISKI